MGAHMTEPTIADPIAGSLVYPAESRVNERGHLEIAGCDAVALAAEFGTPAYVYAEEDIRFRAAAYLDAFRAHTDDFEVLFASKAAPITAIYRLCSEAGLSVDVASGGELHGALAAGFDPSRIYMHGNNKTEAELRYAAESGVGHLILDSFDEIERARTSSAASPPGFAPLPTSTCPRAASTRSSASASRMGSRVARSTRCARRRT